MKKPDSEISIAASLETAKKDTFYIAAFLIPFLVFVSAFALIGIAPFGNRLYLVADGWHQYFPYMNDLWYRLRGEGSFMWSTMYGIGGNYLPLFAYNLASPLNLLLPFFPNESIPTLMAAFTLIKLGFAGLFTSVFLSGVHKRRDILIPVFSACYALCAFAVGYYWNIMWLDTFAMLPLVMYGLHSLVKEGRFVMYTIALALSVLFNFYLGMFVCIFAVIMFHVFHISLPGGKYSRRAPLFAASSLIAGGLTAALTLPTYFGLLYSSDVMDAFPAKTELYHSFFDVIGNFIAFTPPTHLDGGGLPNLYCGMLPVMLAAVFLGSPKFRVREKIAYLAALAFLIVSCNVNTLTFMWSGFHVTNSIPFRFSFLIPFLLVTFACRAYFSIDKQSKRDIAAMAAAVVVILVCAALGSQETKHIVASAAFCAAYIVLFALRERLANYKTATTAVTLAVFIIMAVELGVSARINVSVKYNTADGNDFPFMYSSIRRLLDRTQPKPDEFHRTEFTQPQKMSSNAPPVYRYDGMSAFASTINVNTMNFLEGIGLYARYNGSTYYYSETSPLTSALLNHKYMISMSGRLAEDGFYWEAAAENDKLYIFENTRYLPLGFIVDAGAEGYEPDEKNPFISQNDLFRRMTGLEGDLFTLIEPFYTRHLYYDVTEKDPGEYAFEFTGAGEDDGLLWWDYMMPRSGLLFGYCDFDRTGELYVVSDAKALVEIDMDRAHIFTMGRFGMGDAVALTAEANTDFGNTAIYVAYFNAELFDAGYEKLSKNTMELTAFSETRVAGRVTTEIDGLLYTSIPYEKGWRAYVDGEEAEIVQIGGSMSALRIKAGDHEIEFTYRSYGLIAGILISAVSLAAFIALVLIRRNRGGVAFDKAPKLEVAE